MRLVAAVSLTVLSLMFVVAGGAPPAVAGEGEFGVQLGGLATDKDLTGESGQIDLSFGLRGGYRFSDNWIWTVDTWYADLETPTADAPTFAARTGIEGLLGSVEGRKRWFFGSGLGLTSIDVKGASSINLPFASVGFGQRITLTGQTRLRWELRVDQTDDDADLGGESLITPQLHVGLTWGIGGRRPDADGDGIWNKEDDCPDTPSGARVNIHGCPIDHDGDGVAYGIDKCLDTPQGWPVDATGCPLDSDGDGVPDGRDSCPQTPRGAKVDERGCPVDSDGDGVPDGIDACPKTPSGARVDERGCPSDGDGDGVFDGIDECPATERGVKVNPRGCPVEAPFKPEQPHLVLEDVFFAFDAANLTPESLPVLDKVAESLVAFSDVHVEIQGHTDTVGDAAYNQWLSERRAEAVRAYLVSKGVVKERMTVVGFGATRPRADNKTAEGRASNRRVEMKKLER